MIRGNKIRVISYAAAAGVLGASLAFTTLAAPVAGATAMVSGNPETIEANSYSTLSGVNLSLSKILYQANETAKATSTDVEAVAAVEKKEQTIEEAENEYANIGIAVVNDFVYVRDSASTEGEVVGKLYDKNACNVTAEENGWYRITSGNVDGYVSSEFVTVGDEELVKSASRRVATVTGETLFIREEPTTESSVVGMLPFEDDVTVIDESSIDSGWVKVSSADGEGFVSTDFVTLATEYSYGESKAEEEARLAREEAARKAAQQAARRATSGGGGAAAAGGGSGSYASYSAPSGVGGSAVVDYACQFVGNPYVYGGSSLTNGTDCSGFVMGVYGAFGVGLPHSSAADRGVGYGVSVDQMQPGDIVCYSGHVAIYAGNGTIVHASTPSTGICYSNVNYNQILAVRRIF